MSDIGGDFIFRGMAEALGWLTLTIVLYIAARRVQSAAKGNPLANSVLLAAVPIMMILTVADVPVSQYQEGGIVLLWILGPATVALAVPFFINFIHVRAAWKPMAVALLVGSVVAVISSVLIGHLLGASIETVRSLAPKTVTTPIAMGISEEIGGIPELTAAFVIFTGIIGAVAASAVFKLVGVSDARARGFGMGVAAGGIGTARAFQESLIAGTFSGVGMTLNGIITAILLPLLWLAFS
ncbi:MAG: LrgB family protein [Parvibaculum sp.]|nr:LrgB family protein [Parvibaculum sp.]|tara:strand:+ start:1488 stop:2207 length:720 start_codon:yes stop_codon:yes gene_type:complete